MEIEDTISNLQIKAQQQEKRGKEDKKWTLPTEPPKKAPSFYNYSNDTFDMKYATMNDGEVINKYDNYLPGADNAELAAQNQSTWDKWRNGISKAGINLLTTVAGNTVGFVVGAAEGISQGSWNAVFDNKFSNTLADYNQKLDYKLPNYVSKDEQDDNFFQGMGTANFWAKDVMGGLSFTVGTIVSEAIWGVATGGIVNSAKWGMKGAQLGARWSKLAIGAEEAAVGVANYKKFVAEGVSKLYTGATIDARIVGTAKAFANTAKGLNTARFLATTSGNEAGIEALQYKREQTENFYNNFENLNGRQPTEEEITKFNDNLEGSANAVFATNMAILAPSNMAMFGSLFNIASPTKGLSKAMNKSLFGIGVEKSIGETGEVLYKGLQATTKQKVAQYAYSAFKPLVTEGLWEEGLQGVTTKRAENWITTTYDPKYNNKTISLADATYKAFGEQYGTKEGWKEIGIGAIIGGGSSLFIGKGKFQEVREFEKEQKYQDEYVASGLNQFGDQSSLATDAIARKMMFNARVTNAVERQKQAVDKGDDVGATLAMQDASLAEIQFRKAMGEDTKELVSKYETAMQALPDEAFKERGIEDIQGYKDSVITGYKSLVDSYEKASDFADAVLGESRILGQDIATQHLKDALTYSIVSGQKANVVMDDLLNDMGKIIGDESRKSSKIQTELQKQGKSKQQQVRRLNTNITQAELEVKTLSIELQRLQVSKDETKGTRLQKVQEKLTNANERVVDLKSERETFAQEVSQESKRRRNIQGTGVTDTSLVGEFITGNDLAGIDEKLQKIEDNIKSYEGVNHEVYYDLLDLKRQYNTAKENYFSFQSSVDAIINGKFQAKFARFDGVLGKVFNSKTPIDNFTGEYLAQIWDNYNQSNARATGEDVLSSFISEEDYKTFQETGEISEDILKNLSEVVAKKGELTERENQIFKAKSAEINAILKPNPNKPNLTPENITQKEIEKLEADKVVLEEELGQFISSKDETRIKEIKTLLKTTPETIKRISNISNSETINGLKEFIEKIVQRVARLKASLKTIQTSTPTDKSKVEADIKFFEEDIAKNRETLSRTEEINTTVTELENPEYTTLIEELNNLENVSTTPRGKEIKNRLAEINKELVNIKTNNGTLTEIEQLRKTVEDSFTKDYPMLTQDVDEMIKNKPTEEEVNRYQELYKKQSSFTEEEKAEFVELQSRMQKWFMAQSLPSGDATIADLVEIISQLETQSDRSETLTDISNDILVQETAEQKDASSVTRQDILQNISGNAVAKIKDNEIYFIHVNPKTIFDKLVPNVSIFSVQTVNSKGKLNKSQDLTHSLVESESKKAGTVFNIGNTKITIGLRGEVVMSLENYNSVKDILNLYYFKPDTGSISYLDLYERLDDGSTRKKVSEFETNTNSDYLYDSGIGESLNLFVDMKTDFNQDLISQSLKEIGNNGEISEELKKKINDKLEITSRQGTKNNSTLKALYYNVTNDNFIYLRKKYADKFIKILEVERSSAALPNEIDLEAEVTVKDMYLGTPNFQLDETLKPKELEITETGINKVITQGYVQGSEMVLGDKTVNADNISRLYITNLAKVNPELKIPVVILEKGKYKFAFPITMIKTQESKQKDLADILNNTNTNNVEKSKQVNTLMISLGLSERVVNLTQEKIDAIEVELENYQTFKTADEIADVNYDKNKLIQDATIKVDLDNEVISSPKITIDYDTLTIGKLEDNENEATSLRNEIVKDLKAIENIVNKTKEIPDQNRIMEAFDNNSVENSGSDIMNRKDINFIKKYFFSEGGNLKPVQGVAVETIGKERLLKLREKLQTLQFYENTIKTIKDKQTERNLNC